MKIDNIVLSAIVYSTEDPDKVSQALSNLIPFEFEILVSKATGHFGNPLEFLEVELKRKREIKEFWNNLVDRLGDQREVLVEFIEDVVDEEGVFHIRLNKQSAYLGNVELDFGGDSILVRAKLVTFPARREKIIDFARKIISEGYD
ncbi:RNA-binding domain-containing protein [Geoglobus acetivorans]|uniref:Exosome subunit n=1 Tax=Geoglobus acetivorans TaxID=565033 RepID=A0ABZ3H018_GEOAI|nr:exosome subunit [Geoglobus acetivorans]